MNLLIVSGLSGAGKSNAVNVLEDIGYYCIENIPVSLIPQVASLCQGDGKPENVAMVIDVRAGNFLENIDDSLKSLDDLSISYRILFIEASDDVLERRFKETRRNHPLFNKTENIREALKTEREMLKTLRQRADFVIDTSFFGIKELRTRLTDMFIGGSGGSMKIRFFSFGFKYGMPTDADLMIDVRCLPNPFYEKELRNLTGKDKAIQDFVLEKPETKEFIKRFAALLDFLIPLYIKEGKNSLNVAVGCTGGKHRSVTLADYFADYVSKNHMKATSGHRDINKN